MIGIRLAFTAVVAPGMRERPAAQDPYIRLWLDCGRAAALLDKRQIAEAQAILDVALPRFREIGDLRREAVVLELQALAAERAGDEKGALEKYRSCLERFRALRYMAARFGFLPVPSKMVAKYLEKTREVVPIFDRQLAGSCYLAGDQVTAADLFLAPVLFYFPDIPEMSAIGEAAPNCMRWARDMGGRASVKATDPEMKPRLAA